jgi:hypothetical protein
LLSDNIAYAISPRFQCNPFLFRITKPEHWRVVIAPSPMPTVLEALASKIEDDDRAWLEENRAKCDTAGFVFDPAIKRIEARDYWISREATIPTVLIANPEA